MARTSPHPSIRRQPSGQECSTHRALRRPATPPAVLLRVLTLRTTHRTGAQGELQLHLEWLVTEEVLTGDLMLKPKGPGVHQFRQFRTTLFAAKSMAPSQHAKHHYLSYTDGHGRLVACHPLGIEVESAKARRSPHIILPSPLPIPFSAHHPREPRHHCEPRPAAQAMMVRVVLMEEQDLSLRFGIKEQMDKWVAAIQATLPKAAKGINWKDSPSKQELKRLESEASPSSASPPQAKKKGSIFGAIKKNMSTGF